MQKFLPIKKSIFIVCLAMMLCWIPVTAHAAGHREAPTSPTRILFVGNSYTQRNHMPNIFRKLCKSSGQNVIVRSLTNPGRSLKNTSNPTTANGRKLYRLLRMQRWDYVILQDRRYYPIFQTTAYEKNHPQAGSLYSGQRCKDGPLSDMGPGEMA